MVRIFIVYGKPEGERYGNTIDKYFKRNGLRSFLASPNSPDLKPGENFQRRIDKELDDADVAIVVITRGLRRSIAALDEIARIRTLMIPMVPYQKNNTQRPDELLDCQIVKFKRENVGRKQNLNELELKMWRLIDSRRELMLPTSEDAMPIFQRFKPTEETN